MEGVLSLIIVFTGATLIILVLLGAIGGFVGGIVSSIVLQKLDPTVPKDIRTKIVVRSTLGFLAGAIVGSIPMSLGLAIGMVSVISYGDLSFHWAMFVAGGVALMGAIGTAIAGSALFSKL